MGDGRSGFDRAREVGRRRLWLGLVVFSAALAGSLTLAARLPSIYRSTATVLVEHRQALETLLPGELEARLQTINEEILSRTRLQGLIDRFDLYPDLRKTAAPEFVVAEMRRDIGMEPKGVDSAGGRGTTIAFTLSYRGRDPETAAQVANTMASFYVEEDLKIRERQATGTVQFLKEQLDEAKKRLDAQERRMAEFHDKYMGELPEQTEANLAALERFNVQLRVNAEDRTRALERREELAKRIADADPSTGAPVDASITRLAQLRRELATLRQRFSDQYPDVIAMKTEIAALEKDAEEAKLQPKVEAPAARRPLSGLQEPLHVIEAQVSSLREEEAQLRGQIASYSQRLENAPKRKQELEQISQGYRTTKELYDSLLKRYEEAQLAEGAEPGWKRPRFRILDAAVAPREPVAPNRILLFVMALISSVAMAAGAVVAAEQLDTSFHSVDELRAFTQVPVLTSIRRIITPADARQRRRRFWLAAVGTLAGFVLIVHVSSHVAEGNYTLVSMMTKGRS
jgi:protein tyrosine kinase modulator